MAAATLAPHQGHTYLPPEDAGEVRRVVAALLACGHEGAEGNEGQTSDVGAAGAAVATAIGPVKLVAPDGQSVDLPPALLAVLLDVARAMLSGRAVTVSPTSRRLTAQEAADALGMSLPTLVKLLMRGDIPYERPGRHRRVPLNDLLRYQERCRADIEPHRGS